MSVGASKSKSKTSPLYGGTEFSKVQGGRVILDPSIRGLQGQGISAINTGQDILSRAVGEFGSSMGDLRSRLFGNMDPYLQARTAPLRQEKAQVVGDVTQDIGRRGLSGSTFADQSLSNVRTIFNRDIANQGALATQESIRAGQEIDSLILEANRLEAQGKLSEAEYLRGIAADRANIEAGLLTSTGSESKGSSFSFAAAPKTPSKGSP